MRVNRTEGFTIVELLIVIVVIGILAALVLNTFTSAQANARTAKTEAELKLVDTAIQALAVDTGKWPNGCTTGLQSNPEVDVEDATAGLTQTPPVGVVDLDCEWTSSNVSDWRGPYVADDEIIDAWDNSYVFDPDYYPWQNCSTISNLSVRTVIVSYGPDGLEYTCDDIYREVGNQ